MKEILRLILLISYLVMLILSQRTLVRKEPYSGTCCIKMRQQLPSSKINENKLQNTAKHYIVIQPAGCSGESIIGEFSAYALLDQSAGHFFKDSFPPKMDSLNIFFGEKVLLLTRDEVGIWSTCRKNHSKDYLRPLKFFDIQTLLLNFSLIKLSSFVGGITFPDTRLPEDIYFEVNGKDRYLLRNVSGQNELFFQGKNFKILLKNDIYAKIKELLSTF